MTRETRHAVRRLIRTPGFTVATLLTLMLAIGANSTMFTVVSRVVLNPLPYLDADRLVALDYGIPSRNIASGINYMSWQLYYQLVDRARSFEQVAIYNVWGVTLTGPEGAAEHIQISRASPSLASVSGRSPPSAGEIGIYGVTSSIVSQRTSEIGIRLAVGAAPGDVAAMIIKQGALVGSVGVIGGLGLASAGSRLMASLIYGVSPRDPVVFAGTTALLSIAALLACSVPALRAARLSPLEALRTD